MHITEALGVNRNSFLINKGRYLWGLSSQFWNRAWVRFIDNELVYKFALREIFILYTYHKSACTDRMPPKPQKRQKTVSGKKIRESNTLYSSSHMYTSSSDLPVHIAHYPSTSITHQRNNYCLVAQTKVELTQGDPFPEVLTKRFYSTKQLGRFECLLTQWLISQLIPPPAGLDMLGARYTTSPKMLISVLLYASYLLRGWDSSLAIYFRLAFKN